MINEKHNTKHTYMQTTYTDKFNYKLERKTQAKFTQHFHTAVTVE